MVTVRERRWQEAALSPDWTWGGRVGCFLQGGRSEPGLTGSGAFTGWERVEGTRGGERKGIPGRGCLQVSYKKSFPQVSAAVQLHTEELSSHSRPGGSACLSLRSYWNTPGPSPSCGLWCIAGAASAGSCDRDPWPAEPQTVTSWSFTDNVCCPCPCQHFFP